MVASLDIAQAKRQIELLGLGTKVFLRGFYHSDDPRKNEDKGRKTNKLDAKLIESWMADKRGVYLVVNGGGHEDKLVKSGTAVFYEHDDLDKELQLTLWQSLGLPQPTFQVDTGGKSIHSYWVFDFPIPIEDWRKLQADLLEFADADRSIKNPSRVMRLAGAYHQNGNRSELINISSQKYPYEELRSLIPEQGTLEPKTPYQPSISDDVPLYNCLSKDDRQLIDSGIAQGGRNSAGAKLARNLIGTAKRLEYLGYHYEGSPRDLFDLFCSRCSPRLEDKEAEQIWKSAEKDNPTATLTDDALENCVKAFHNQSKTPKTGIKSDFIASSQNQSQLSQKSTIREDLKRLINSNLSESEQEERLQEIAKQHDKTDGQINRLFKSILKESESSEQLEQHKAELEQLLKIDSQTIRLSDYLHPHLARPLAQISQWLGMPESAMLTVLLPVAASLMPIDTRLELIKSSKFYAHPILYTALVGESGIGKTPVLKKIVGPLYAMQDEALTEHNQAIAEHNQACSIAKKNNEPEPPRPKLHNYFTSDATAEAIAKIQNDQPTRGFVGYFDELEGMFKAAGQYKAGKGNDTERMLSGRDGTGFKVDRSNGNQLFVKQSGYSITGGIQPDVLRKRTGDLSDPNGQNARFIWDYLGKVKSTRYPESDICYDSDELLRGIYQRLERQSAITHILSPKAKQQYKQWFNHLADLIDQETRQGMRSVLAKMKGVTGELALILHRLNAAIANQPLSVEVDDSTMSQAISLARYYLYQVKLLHADAEGETVNGNPTGKLKKILELSERLGTVSAREVKNGIWQYRKATPEEIRLDFFKLEAMGYGQTGGTGNRLKFKTVDVKLKTVEVHQQTTQTTAQWRFEKSEGKTVEATVEATVEVIKKPETPVTQAIQLLKKQTVDVVDEIHSKSRELKDSQPLEQKTRDGDSEDQLMEFYKLKKGDLLIEEDSTGSPQTIQLTEKITHCNSWKTSRKNQFISLDDWRSGRVRKPTVEDVATLIKRNPDRKTFRWLYRNLEPLQIKAIQILAEDPKNEQLIEQLYDFLNPITLNDHAQKALEDLKQKMRDLGKIAQKQFFEIWGDNGLLAIQFAEEEGRIRVEKGIIQTT